MSLDPQAPISDLGEDGLVAVLRERFSPGDDVVGIGDDAAVFASPGRRLAATTDTLVEGVDFDLAYFSGADLGYKALAVNVSDLAAMGAEPAYALATLCLPPATPVGFVSAIIDGLSEAASRWGASLVGGDLSSATAISLGIALFGRLEGEAILRSGAVDGDGIFVTGELGGSAAGLQLLQKDPVAEGALVDRHRRPRARLEESRALRSVGITSMIDISDGFVVDLERLMSASDIGCDVDPALVPVDPHLAAVGDGAAMGLALFGGEDFELLFTAPPGNASRLEDAVGRLGTRVTRVGTVTTGPRLLGESVLDDIKEAGWDHLRSR